MSQRSNLILAQAIKSLNQFTKMALEDRFDDFSAQLSKTDDYGSTIVGILFTNDITVSLQIIDYQDKVGTGEENLLPDGFQGEGTEMLQDLHDAKLSGCETVTIQVGLKDMTNRNMGSIEFDPAIEDFFFY